MYGNGAKIGTIKLITKALLAPTPKVQIQAAPASCAGVRGTTARTSSELPVATTAVPSAGSAALVFVYPGAFSFYLSYLFTFCGFF